METGVAIGVYNVLDIFTDNEEYDILSATAQHRAELYCFFLSLFARREHVPRIANFAEFVIPQYSAGDFKAHLRISTETHEKVVELISEDLAAEYNGGHLPIAPDKAILLFVWYLSNQDSMREISHLFGISMSTVHGYIHKVARTLVSKMKKVSQIICLAYSNYYLAGIDPHSGADVGIL